MAVVKDRRMKERMNFQTGIQNASNAECRVTERESLREIGRENKKTSKNCISRSMGRE